MKIKNKSLIALLSSFSFMSLATAAESVPAAKISRVDGNAIASQDARYLPAREGMALKEGDRLMVLENSTAIVTFTDGCQYTLKDMGVLVVQKMSTCALQGAGVYNFDPRTAVSSGKTPTLTHAQTIPPAPAGMAPWVIPAAIGTVFVTTTAIVVNEENKNDDEPNPSPIL